MLEVPLDSETKVCCLLLLLFFAAQNNIKFFFIIIHFMQLTPLFVEWWSGHLAY